MPRRARVLLPGVTLHLIQRRNNRSPVSSRKKITCSIWSTLRIKPENMTAQSMLGV